MKVTVVVPTYRRVEDLDRCLAALREQTRPAEEVLVTIRNDDAESTALVEQSARGWPSLRAVPVKRPGVVAAMNAALAAVTGDIYALTDDDAEPHRDWLARIVPIFEQQPGVAAVGGRDDQVGAPGDKTTVGKLQWFGRIIGNHHVGAGPAREVDVVKGVCSAFRMSALREIGFDERLRGSGAQVHWELSLCLALARAGWRLVYDPAIRVRHHVGTRHDADQLHRGRFAVEPHENAVYNETLVLAEHLRGARRVAFKLWASAIGTAVEPGVLQVPRAFLRDGFGALTRWRATQRARGEGFRDARR
ncbi:MAG: glycosyltransferase [Gemmatimonadota bacterium]